MTVLVLPTVAIALHRRDARPERAARVLGNIRALCHDAATGPLPRG